MAITYDSSSQGFISAGTTGTFSHTCTGSNVYLYVLTDSDATNVTYAGVSMTKLNSNIIASNGGYDFVPGISVWGMVNPTTGTNNVSVKAGAKNETACSYSLANVDPGVPESYVTNQTNGNLTTAQQDSITTLTNNAWYATFIKGTGNLGRNFTAGSGTTLRQTQSQSSSSNASGILDGGAVKTPAGLATLNTNWSSSTGWFSSVMYSIKPYLKFTLTGPASGSVNSASTNFTVTPDVAVTGTITITPSGVGSTGLSPVVLTFSNSATPQTFTITPTTSGAITLTPTNAVGLNNPTYLSFTANAVVPTTTVIGTAIPDNVKAFVYFSAPSSDGGTAITSYTAVSTPGSITGTGASSPVTVTGLTNGTPYTFKVKATNAVGDGPLSSASNSVTPFLAATSFTFTGPTSGNVRSASTNFTVTPNAVFYGTITITPSGVGSTGLSSVVLTFSGSSTAQTFTITPTVAGAVTLTPSNSGTLTNPSNIVYTASAVVPLSPTLTVVPDIDSLRVTVVAPSNNGGSTITQYTVTCSNGTVMTASVAGEIIFNGLTPGTIYTFYATATNSIGTSSNSSTTTGVTPLDITARYFNSGPKFNINNSVGNALSVDN